MATITLTAQQVRAAVSMPEAIAAVRRALIDLDAGAFEQPARTVLGDGRFLVMSAHHRPTSSAMVKTLSLNFARTPGIVGTVVWTAAAVSDLIVADAASVTSLRTGAIVGVATDLLAPPEAGHLVLIGAGGQAADQIRAVHAVRPLRTLTVVNRTADRAARLLESLAGELDGVATTVSTSVAESLPGADIVCCATPAAAPLFDIDAVPARVHVNAVGAYRPSMRELPSELLANASVFVDERSAALEESGEIIHALAVGAVRESDLTELGSALRHGAPPVGKRTVFKSVGLAVQDWAIISVLAAKHLDGPVTEEGRSR
jgi:ornithine cyclodeaminase